MQEAKEKQEKVKDTMAVLDWQRNTRQVQRQQEEARLAQEREMLKQQWIAEEEREKKAEQQKFLLNRERNLELINHNATEKQLREQAEEQDRIRDKVLLDAALQREKQLQDLEVAEKQARRNEIVELQKHYGNVANEKAEYEKMVDQLVENENIKQWEAREAQWRREDQARVNLMKNVYQNREQAIILNQKQKEEAAWLQKYELD